MIMKMFKGNKLGRNEDLRTELVIMKMLQGKNSGKNEDFRTKVLIIRTP